MAAALASSDTTDARTYPFKCDLCGYEIESADDAMWWHGYGNCVEITDEMWEQWRQEALESEQDAKEADHAGRSEPE